MAREKGVNPAENVVDKKQICDAAQRAAEENRTKVLAEVEALRKEQMDSIRNRVEKFEQYLKDTFGKEMDMMPEDFITKYENYTYEEAPLDVTMQAMGNVEYLLNSSHHDEEIKNAAAILLKRMRKEDNGAR